jgi:hypothetical protein
MLIKLLNQLLKNLSNAILMKQLQGEVGSVTLFKFVKISLNEAAFSLLLTMKITIMTI